MLVKPTMENLMKKVSSRYVLTILAAKRARQLVDGAQPMAESDSPNFVTTACEEIASNNVLAIRGIHHPFVPLRPEVEAERLREELEKRNARYREDMEEENNARMRSLISAIDKDDDIDDDLLVIGDEPLDFEDSVIEVADIEIEGIIDSDETDEIDESSDIDIEDLEDISDIEPIALEDITALIEDEPIVDEDMLYLKNSDPILIDTDEFVTLEIPESIDKDSKTPSKRRKSK